MNSTLKQEMLGCFERECFVIVLTVEGKVDDECSRSRLDGRGLARLREP